jgi:hypothetical protein
MLPFPHTQKQVFPVNRLWFSKRITFATLRENRIKKSFGMSQMPSAKLNHEIRLRPRIDR